MTAVLGETGIQAAGTVVERRMVIHIGDLMFGGVLSEHRIELRDGCRRFDLGAPRKPVAGQHRAEHHADPVEFGQFAHRDDVAEDVFEFDGAVVLSDVVDTGKDHHGLRVQVDDVAAETREHLGGRLAADTPVDEAVAELSKEKFRIDAPDLPNGVKSRLHLAISDASGDSAIFEYVDGRLSVHHGREYQVMTNSPFYDQQLAILDYWQQIGGLTMLPGTNRAPDRFVRASFYINAVVKSADPKVAVPAVMSVMRNVSVPYGISTPDKPHIASTRWRTVCDQKNRIYYFEPTLAMETFWVDLSKIDFGQGTPERVLKLVGGRTFTGDATAEFRRSDKPFVFLFGV